MLIACRGRCTPISPERKQLETIGCRHLRRVAVSESSPEGPIIDLTPDEVRPIANEAPEGSVTEPVGDGVAESITTPPPPTAPSPPTLPGIRVTFRGNTYDLAAYSALFSGVIVLTSCLTCNTVTYCLPLIPIVLGLIGIVSANQSVDARRTRTWSWIGIASGLFILLLTLAGIVLYIAFIVLMIYLGEVD